MLSNFFNSSCNGPLWLWEAEIQLSLIFTLILFIELKLCTQNNKRTKKFLFLVGILCLGSIAYSLSLYKPISLSEYYLNSQLLGKARLPFCKFPSYLLGYFMGSWYLEYLRNQNKNELRIYKVLKNKWLRLCMIVLVVAFVASYFYLINYLQTQQTLVFFEFFILQIAKNFSSVMFLLIILPSIYGFSTVVKKLLESQIFRVLAKINAATYGAQSLVLYYLNYSRNHEIYFSMSSLLGMCAIGIIPSYIIGFLLYTTIDYPISKAVELKLDPKVQQQIQY